MSDVKAQIGSGSDSDTEEELKENTRKKSGSKPKSKRTSKKSKSDRSKSKESDLSDEDDSGNDSDSVHLSECDSDTIIAARKKKNASRKTPPTAGVKKNPPGRPRKQPVINLPPVKGIVTSPDDPSNSFELLYHSPAQIKKISLLIKNIGAAYVQILIRQQNLILFVQDKYKTNTSMIMFDGSKMNQFYYKKEMDIAVLSKDFIKVCGEINKRHSCFAVCQAIALENKEIDVLFLNGYTGIRANKSIKVTKGFSADKNNGVEGGYPKLTKELMDQMLSEDATIKFQYPSYDFKQLIGASKGEEHIRFRQNGGSKSFVIEAEKSEGRIKSRDVFDPKIIRVKFESKVPEDDIFTITASIEALKAISSASLGKNIDVYLTEKKPILTKINIDDNITVCTLTKLSERIVRPKIKTKPKKKRNESSDDEASDNEDNDGDSDTQDLGPRQPTLEIPKIDPKILATNANVLAEDVDSSIDNDVDTEDTPSISTLGDSSDSD
jgi:hypothetical protein